MNNNEKALKNINKILLLCNSVSFTKSTLSSKSL